MSMACALRSLRSWHPTTAPPQSLLGRRPTLQRQTRVFSTRRAPFAPPSFASLGRLHDGLVSLRRILDDHVVGQDSVKEALLLGLLAREHVYIEGPPGIAKTYISELVSASTSLSHWFYQMHRDTRLNEIIGEAIIVKDTTATGETIRQDIIRGGILDCELAVLDDISRAPGEALNVLLRILNERTYGSGSIEKIPLLSAIATSNPANDDSYYAEPLDPATLDRFTLQLRVTGLVNQGDWKAVEDVIDLYSAPRLASDSRHVDAIERDVIIEASELVPLVVLGEPTKKVLVELLRVLRDDYGLGEGNSLLTDRTFLIKAAKILKAQAVLQGRQVCEPRDLFAMRFLTTFRVPTKVHEEIEQIIADILRRSTPTSPPADSDPDGAADPKDDENESEADVGGGGLAAKQQEGNEEPSSQASTHFTYRTHALSATTDKLEPRPNEDSVESLLRALKGEIEKGTAAQIDHPGGLPRTWSKLRCLSDITDADPIATSLWCAEPVPALPRSQRRTRPLVGGQMAIIRDTSLSMMGPWNHWASLLCPAVVDLAKRHRMKVGYLEFNSIVDKFVSGDPQRFFSREYDALSSSMQYIKCRGNTNYEQALSLALSKFRSGATRVKRQQTRCQSVRKKRCNQHVLFITDGHPSEGDLTVAREIRAAQNLGIALHTIFIGYGECPAVLDEMSLRTNGSRHAAQFAPGSYTVRVRDRRSIGAGDWRISA